MNLFALSLLFDCTPGLFNASACPPSTRADQIKTFVASFTMKETAPQLLIFSTGEKYSRKPRQLCLSNDVTFLFYYIYYMNAGTHHKVTPSVVWIHIPVPGVFMYAYESFIIKDDFNSLWIHQEHVCKVLYYMYLSCTDRKWLQGLGVANTCGCMGDHHYRSDALDTTPV